MDRIILVALSTGMLAYHHRLGKTSSHQNSPDDKDEMQLGSLFSALHHLREGRSKDARNIILHEQGESVWATGVINNDSGKYILAFNCKSYRYSRRFWDIVMAAFQQEFQFIPMDRENNSKLRKLIQGAIQSGFKKCALQLSEKLTFGRYCESCRPCGLFFRAFAESQLSPPVHVPSLKISNDGPPVSPSSPSSSHYISPRPKANELRSAVEEPAKKSTMENYDVPVKKKSFLSMCCSSRSSVSAISRNSIHIDPGPSTAPRRQPASAGSPITATQPSTSSSSPVSPAISIPSDRWEVQSPVYFNLLTNEEAPLIRTDKLVSVFRNLKGDSSASFVLFNQNWEVISTSLLDDERTANILSAAKPPSPSAADGKASKIPTSEFKIESLEEEDMSVPSPPVEDRKVSDDLKSFWIVQVSKTVSAVFSVRGANVSTECIDPTTSREFLHFISFCFEEGLLPCSPIH